MPERVVVDAGGSTAAHQGLRHEEFLPQDAHDMRDALGAFTGTAECKRPSGTETEPPAPGPSGDLGV